MLLLFDEIEILTSLWRLHLLFFYFAPVDFQNKLLPILKLFAVMMWKTPYNLGTHSLHVSFKSHDLHMNLYDVCNPISSSVCLYVYLFIWMPTYSSVYLYICLPTYLFIKVHSCLYRTHICVYIHSLYSMFYLSQAYFTRHKHNSMSMIPCIAFLPQITRVVAMKDGILFITLCSCIFFILEAYSVQGVY